MTPTAWQLACGLDAWRVTQIPRRPERQEAARAGDDHRDLLAGQRAAVLSAAYHGGAGTVGFAWVRDRAGGPVQVLAAGRGLAIAAGEQDAVLKVPAGGRGTAIGAGGLARALAVLPSWVRVAGVADSLLAEGSRPGPGRGPTEGPGIRPSLEDGVLAAWKEPFAWLVLAEPTNHGELRELTFAAHAAQGAAQRFDNPQAQLAARRLQDRRFVLRPEFDTIPETENKTETDERGIFLGHLLDRERMRAGAARHGPDARAGLGSAVRAGRGPRDRREGRRCRLGRTGGQPAGRVRWTAPLAARLPHAARASL